MSLKIKPSSFLLIMAVLILPAMASAAGIVPCGTSENPDPCTLCHLIIGVKRLIDFGLELLITAAIVAITIAGIMYIVSSGNEQTITIAKNFLSASLKGFAIALMAWFLVNITMWILSAKENLDIGVVNWYTFTCNTKSSAGTGSGGSSVGIGGTAPTPTCTPGTGKCAESNLSCFGSQAVNASVVCQAESGGDPNNTGVPSTVDKCGSASASWGLFQINISCHNIGGNNCTSAFSCCYNGKSCDKSTCQVKDTEIFNKCVAAAKDLSTNVQYACNLYKSGGWSQWGAAKKCGVK